MVGILQDSVDKTGMLERADLRAMTGYLDTIENNVASIAPNDKNNLVRIQTLTLAMFKRAKKLKDVKENADLVKGALAKVCRGR